MIMSDKSVACALQIAGVVAISAAAWDPAPVFQVSRLTASKSFNNRNSRGRINTPKSSPKTRRRSRSATPALTDLRAQPQTGFEDQQCE